MIESSPVCVPVHVWVQTHTLSVSKWTVHMVVEVPNDQNMIIMSRVFCEEIRNVTYELLPLYLPLHVD